MNLFRSTLLLLLCCHVTPAFAQYQQLLNKSYAQRAPQLWALGDAVYFERDSAKAFTITRGLREFGKKNRDRALWLEADLLEIFYLQHYFPAQQSRIINTLNRIIAEGQQYGIIRIEASARDILAGYYWHPLQQYEQALEEYTRLDSLLDPVSDADFPDKIQMIYHIGSAYFNFKDYTRAIHYFKKVPQMKPIPKFDACCYSHAINTLALAYTELGKLDSSDHYLHFLRQHKATQKDSTWLGIIDGNLGYNEFLRKNFGQAIPLLKTCIAQASKDRDWGLAAGSLMPLAEIYYRQNKPAAAMPFVLQAQEYVIRSGQYKRYQLLYPLLSKLYMAKGQPSLAGRYLDSTVLVIDSLNRQFSGLLVARTIQKNALMQQQAQAAAMENRKQLLTIKYYAAIAIALLIFLVAIYVYRNKRKQHYQQQLLKELQLQEAERELASANTQLQDFARSMAEKNKLIETFREKFGNNEQEALQQLYQSVILTGQDWGRFKQLFEQVYTGYLPRLSEKIPGISPAEIRVMALAKLHLSNKEMATALGVSPEAIRVTWHRLRKKANLPLEGNVEELVNSI